MGERLRLSALWDRVAVILREDIHVLLPVAAAFFFLPSIVLTRFVPSAAIGEFSLPMLVSILLILFFQTIGDRKSVVSGKRVSVGLDFGGGRIIKKKKKKI